MQSFATRKMTFKFDGPEGASKKEEPSADEPETDEDDTEATPAELGMSLGAAVKSGNGEAIYEAFAKLVSHCSKD